MLTRVEGLLDESGLDEDGKGYDDGLDVRASEEVIITFVGVFTVQGDI